MGPGVTLAKAQSDLCCSAHPKVQSKTTGRVSGDRAGHRTRRESKEVLPAASCTKGTSLFTGVGVAMMGENPAVLAAGMTMPLLAPRVALSREYERQEGEKR